MQHTITYFIKNTDRHFSAKTFLQSTNLTHQIPDLQKSSGNANGKFYLSNILSTLSCADNPKLITTNKPSNKVTHLSKIMLGTSDLKPSIQPSNP